MIDIYYRVANYLCHQKSNTITMDWKTSNFVFSITRIIWVKRTASKRFFQIYIAIFNILIFLIHKDFHDQVVPITSGYKHCSRTGAFAFFESRIPIEDSPNHWLFIFCSFLYDNKDSTNGNLWARMLGYSAAQFIFWHFV